MKGLRIVVCMKVVPKPEEVSVDPETATLARARSRSEINAADMNALEAALALRGRAGLVLLLSMGPPFFEGYLRVALAAGADEAYLLSDRRFGGADTLATSYVLAAGLRRLEPFDLVLCGEESSDGATGQVPAGIAEWLGLPQVTYATALRVDRAGRTLHAYRELDGGFQAVVAPLPAVVAVRASANEPRFIDMDRWRWAQERAALRVWDLEQLGLAEQMVGLQGSATSVVGLREAERRQRRRQLIHGTLEEEATALAQILSEHRASVRRN